MPKSNTSQPTTSQPTTPPIGGKGGLVLFFKTLSLLPLRVLYVFSDFEYLIMYYIIRYRRGIVRQNLTSSFPEKNINEIKRIERKFYRWFCDYFFEAIKLMTISRKELEKRFTVTNSEEIEECFQQGQDVATILGHYCNWEWLSNVGMFLPSGSVVGLIYKPLRNRAMDEVYKLLRSHQGGTPVPKNEILRYLVQYRRQNIRSIFGYISDQGPKWQDIHLWLPFLNHETSVFTGAERIMRKMNNAVFYVEMSRPRRGYYECTYKLITKDPASLGDNEITRRFFIMLEETIHKEPAYYLWTHNRWKRTKEEFDKRFTVKHGKVIEKER